MATMLATYREVFGFVRREWRDLFKTSGLLLVPNAVIMTLVGLIGSPREGGAPPPWVPATGAVLGLIHHGVTLFTTCAVALFVASRMAHLGWGWSEVWRRALGAVRPIVTSMLALLVLIAACVLVFVLPLGILSTRLGSGSAPSGVLMVAATLGIGLLWGMVRLAFVSAVTVVERRGGFAALARSLRLTRGHALGMFMVLLPVMLVGLGAGWLMVQAGRTPNVTVLGFQLLSWVATSIQGTLVTYLYVQRRYEAEGCDVGALGAELARTATR